MEDNLTKDEIDYLKKTQGIDMVQFDSMLRLERERIRLERDARQNKEYFRLAYQWSYGIWVYMYELCKFSIELYNTYIYKDAQLCSYEKEDNYRG